MTDEIAFLPEDPAGEDTEAGQGAPWKVLVVDDDLEIHQVTHLVLEGLVFHDRPVVMLSAGSAEEARQVLVTNPDIAVLLLDVVMETDDAGLALVSWLRETMGRTAVRIILRTGQPGQAPEKDVVVRFDINDYRSKSELTAQKLLTATVSALRAYEAFSKLEQDQRALESAVAERTQALRASEEHFRALLEAVPEGVVTVDHEGRIQTFSPAAERIFGWAPWEILTQPFEVLFGDGTGKSCRRLDVDISDRRWTAMTGRQAFEVTGRRKDGSMFPADLSLNRTQVNGQEVFVSLVRDATDRRRVEETLRRAKEEAEQAAKAKSEFLAMMSHEIRTPMNGILGMSQLLLESPLSLQDQEYAETIHQSGSALLTVLNDILDFSKLEAGRLDLEAVPFDISALVTAAAALMEGKAEEKGLSFTVDFAQGLPGILVGDPHRLRQVILNLISNAVKFTEEGGIAIYVGPGRILNDQPDSMEIRVSVTDTGIGVAPAVRPHLFRHFAQADSSISRRFGGTGLGLAISRKIVQLMHGEIGLDSVEGRGSTFWFTCRLPIGSRVADSGPKALSATADSAEIFSLVDPIPDPTVVASVSRTPPTSDRSPSSPSAHYRLLVAEDNSVNRTIIVEQLERLGHQVVTATDGQQVLEIAQAQPFDVIIMDIQMPRLDGLQAAEGIRAKGPNRQTPILGLSATQKPEDLHRFAQAHLYGPLLKPVGGEDLQRALNELTKRHHGSRSGTFGVSGQSDVRATSEPNVCDPTLLKELEVALGHEQLKEILTLFGKDALRLVEQIEDSLVVGDLSSVAALLRDLRSSASGFGFRALCAAVDVGLSNLQVPEPQTDHVKPDHETPVGGLAASASVLRAVASLRPAIDAVLSFLEGMFPAQTFHPEP